jgi:membrane protease YdiL (CAAX protease family)
VALLLGMPGIVALVGYIYVTTPATAVPAGLSLPLLALVSAVNPLLLSASRVCSGPTQRREWAYSRPSSTGRGAAARSGVIDRTGSGSEIWQHLRNEVGLAVGIGIFGVLIVILDAVMMPFVAQDLPQSVIGATRPTVLDIFAYVPVQFLYGVITEELMFRFGFMSVLVFVGWRITGRRADGPQPAVVWAAIVLAAVLFGLGHLPSRPVGRSHSGTGGADGPPERGRRRPLWLALLARQPRGGDGGSRFVSRPPRHSLAPAGHPVLTAPVTTTDRDEDAR